MSHKCKNCGNKMNEGTTEYSIYTRHEQKPKLTIENLDIFKCTVCEYYVIPESSQKDIDLLKFQLLEEMKNMAPVELEIEEQEEPEWEEKNRVVLDPSFPFPLHLRKLQEIKKMFQRWIS